MVLFSRLDGCGPSGSLKKEASASMHLHTHGHEHPHDIEYAQTEQTIEDTTSKSVTSKSSKSKSIKSKSHRDKVNADTDASRQKRVNRSKNSIRQHNDTIECEHSSKDPNPCYPNACGNPSGGFAGLSISSGGAPESLEAKKACEVGRQTLDTKPPGFRLKSAKRGCRSLECRINRWNKFVDKIKK